MTEEDKKFLKEMRRKYQKLKDQMRIKEMFKSIDAFTYKGKFYSQSSFIKRKKK